MEATIPTQEQLEEMRSNSRYTKWAELYKSLEQHGSLIVPGDGKGKRMAYDHFKKLGRRVRWKFNRKDDTYGIWLDGDFESTRRKQVTNGQTSQV